MANPDIGGTSGQIGGPGAIYTVGSISTPSQGGVQSIGFTDKDSISAAELQAALLLLNIQNPILIPPSEGSSGSIEKLALEIGKTYQEICRSILDKWSENLEQIAERRRREENDPIKRAEKEEIRLEKLGIYDNFRSYVAKLNPDNPSDLDMLAFVTSSLVISAAYIGPASGVMDVASTSQVGVTPQIDMAASFMPQVGMIAGDNRAELGLIGTLMMSGALFASNVERVVDKGAGKPVDDMALATNYANRLLRLTKSERLDDFIKAMLGDRYTASSAAMLKVIMLTSALAALYKAATKWVTGQEIQDLISGKLPPSNKTEAELVAAIRQQLSLMTAADQATTIAALLSYMNSNPKFESFFEVGKTFDAVTAQIKPPQDVNGRI